MELINTVKAKTILKVGQRVTIIADDDNYTSRIEDLNADTLILAMPLDSKRRPIIPLTGTQVDVQIFDEACVYQITVEYKDKAAKPIPVWIVSMPEEAEKKQNRKFVRVKAAIPLQVQVPDAEGNLQAACTTETIDISGSGFLFVFNKRLPLQTEIVIETDELPKLGRLKAAGEVVRCNKPFFDRELFWVAVKFQDLGRGLQNRLVQFVFQKQREALAKRVDR